ncbi:hypothetical protein [Aliiglaciecola sp. NS0011-25]|uniref:hypothetical protein n=1 Tax=Aliiglaciecola sp. NS0011-25 TaxID=3127654 RepID=UPI0031048022
MALLNIKIMLPKDAAFTMHRLADCEFLSKVFATKIIELDNTGRKPRRLVDMRGHQFVEEIIQLSDTKLVYQIVGNGPIQQHQGQINYISNSTKPHLQYLIEGQSNTWVPNWLLKVVMFYDFKLAGKRLRKLLYER